MKIQLLKSHRRLKLRISLTSIIVFAIILILFYFLTPRLTTEQVENRVRLCLKKKISTTHMEQLKKSGRSLPDHETAQQWEDDFVQIERLKINSLSIKRPFPDILFGFDSPVWVVRVTILDETRKENTRYFWLSRDGPDREMSKWAWIFSI